VRALRSVHVVDLDAPSTTRTIHPVLVHLADPAGNALRLGSFAKQKRAQHRGLDAARVVAESETVRFAQGRPMTGLAAPLNPPRTTGAGAAGAPAETGMTTVKVALPMASLRPSEMV
jgi:hypothetical protein